MDMILDKNQLNQVITTIDFGTFKFHSFFISSISKPRPNYVRVNYMKFFSPFQYILGLILRLVPLFQFYPHYSSDRFHFFKSILTTSLHVLFSLPFFLEGSSSCIENLFLIGVVVGLQQISPNHLKQTVLNLSPIDATS